MVQLLISCKISFFVFLILSSIGSYLFAQPGTYKDSSMPIEKRVADLMNKMTLEEKIGQMSQLPLSKLIMDANGIVIESSLDSLFKGSSIGTVESPFIGVDEISRFSEAADKYLREKTRLGIPALQIAECIHGQLAFGATIFPQAIGQGCTWNPPLIKKMSAVIAAEANLSGVDQALSPLFDLARDPRYGRVEECYSEDPYLVAEMGKAYVTGMQGEPEATKDRLPEGKLACTAKHFAGYSVPLGGINLGPVNVGMREMRSLHLYPFKKAVEEANVYSVMPSYNEVDGIPSHANDYLIKKILRDEYKFSGYIYSDYDAVWMLEHFHKVTGNKQETAVTALNAGIDLEAPYNYSYSELLHLVKSGKVSEKLIDQSVKNILTVKFKTGLFDKPYKAPKNVSDLIHTPASVNLSREIAEESIVLLKNENGILPLDISKYKSIAVIGPNANQVQYGDYSVTKDNASGVTIYEGVKNFVKGKVNIYYSQGCGITNLDKSGFDEAIRIAKKSDIVILVVGGTSMPLQGVGWGKEDSNDHATCGEGYDRTELIPPGVQPELIREIYKTGKPVIYVLIHGRPYDLSWETKHFPAIIDAWYPGEQGGNAVANILFGVVNPSGKLSMSLPQNVGQLPVFYNTKPSGKGFYRKPGTPEKPGRDYVFCSPDPLYPFGFGLSYTNFEYSELNIKSKTLSLYDTIKFTVNVKNIGKVRGKEVVQIYINDKVSSVTTPSKALKSFTKIDLEAGEKREVNFNIPCYELGLWNKDMKYVVEPGEFEIMVGASSEDIKLSETISVK